MKEEKSAADNNAAASKNDDTSLIPSALEEADTLFDLLSASIEERKSRIEDQASMAVTMLYWEVGDIINSALLNGKRGKYGKQILSTVSTKLTAHYGRGFEMTNLYRMMRFAEEFSDPESLAVLSPKLSWSHIVELLPLKTQEARMYYAQDVAERKYSVRELRYQISRKAYERREIANTALSDQSLVPFNLFQDPYLLDVLGLKDTFLEADLEKAILAELERFILEFGKGFSFVERQKRMSVGGDEFVLDLLFYNRPLRRLVAVELKVGSFKPAFKGQMELYLKWLDQHERREDEETPVGIILCTAANREMVETLEMDKAGISVAEYWTELPPKKMLEEKIQSLLAEAQERLEQRKGIPAPLKSPRQVGSYPNRREDK